MSDDPGSSVSQAPPDDEPELWRSLFGYTEPYANQADAITSAIEAGERGGFLAMEGPCGTGKTMAALTAGATLVRSSDRYDRIVVITPVKQQLEQFVTDLRRINSGLEQPFSGIALVGKADLCPYEREGVFPSSVGVHDRCEDLRDTTANLVAFEDESRRHTETPLAQSTAPAAIGAVRDGTEQWWDPERASDLVRDARSNTSLETAGAQSPYPREQPSVPDQMADASEGDLYCPFEADWYARNKGSPIDFEAGREHVVTSDELLPETVQRGTCPHRAMGVLLEEADVVIGNYNHVFDPATRGLTAAILDDRTFLVVDEAHRLEERVRGLLSDSIGRQSLQQVRNECELVHRHSRQSPTHEREVERLLGEHDVSIEDVERAHAFYEDVLEWLEARVEGYLNDEFDVGRFGVDDLPERDLEIPLRDPETAEPDELSQWAERHGYTGDLWRRLGRIGLAVEEAVESLEPARDPIATAVGVLAEAWWVRDHTTYFRELSLAYSPTEARHAGEPWERRYTPSLSMYNCMPTGALSDVFDEMGGGMLMSATLEPLDVFRQVTGLDQLASEHDSRPVLTRTYDLRFPPENRASWLVDAPPFTARNRGAPEVDNENPVREEYAHALRQLARSDGNVMLCLPNYREATWAAARLRQAVEKDVLLDESTSTDVTDDLKDDFFAGDPKVLVTSTRGTLTEGVDYEGEKLQTCAVIGVPLVDTRTPRNRAVRHAYEHAFGAEHAYDYALTISAVRRARQAIGRVIRGPAEQGVRVLVDERYTDDARFNSVHEFLSPDEREEFVQMTPDFLSAQFDRFWSE